MVNKYNIVDITSGSASVCLLIPLLWQCYQIIKHKRCGIDAATSLLTAFFLIIICVGNFFIELYIYAATTSLSAIIWIFIFILSQIYKNNKNIVIIDN